MALFLSPISLLCFVISLLEAELSKINKTPLIKLPGGIQPRVSIGYSFFALLKFFENSGFIASKKEDTKKAEQIKAKNNAEAMVTTAEKALKDAGDKVPKDVKEKVEEKVKNLKEVAAKEGSSKEDVEAATKELSESLSQIGQSMYGQGQKEEPKKGEKKEEKKKDKKKDKKEEKIEEGEVVN